MVIFQASVKYEAVATAHIPSLLSGWSLQISGSRHEVLLERQIIVFGKEFDTPFS
jgi:hypothetical protein